MKENVSLTPINSALNTLNRENTLGFQRQVKLKICDPWGTEVYQDNNYHLHLKWVLNETLPPGTYFYFLTIEEPEKETQKQGFIEIHS